MAGMRAGAREGAACRSRPTRSSSTSSSSPPTSATAAVDVVLLDTTFWGGIRPCIKAAAVCETFQLGVAVHSSGELGIQLATMLHLGRRPARICRSPPTPTTTTSPTTSSPAASSPIDDGSIAVPTGPGLGVRLDREKLGRYDELYRRLGGYPYDRDPLRPGWYPPIPNGRWADPADARQPRTSSPDPHRAKGR